MLEQKPWPQYATCLTCQAKYAQQASIQQQLQIKICTPLFIIHADAVKAFA